MCLVCCKRLLTLSLSLSLPLRVQQTSSLSLAFLFHSLTHPFRDRDLVHLIGSLSLSLRKGISRRRSSPLSREPAGTSDPAAAAEPGKGDLESGAARADTSLEAKYMTRLNIPIMIVFGTALFALGKARLRPFPVNMCVPLSFF